MLISRRKMTALPFLICCLPAVASVAYARPASIQKDQLTIQNNQLTVTVDEHAASYEIKTDSSQRALMRARVAAEIDRQWLRSDQYPVSKTEASSFHDDLGSGQQLVTTFSGPAEKPSLIRVLHLYQNAPYGDVKVIVRNGTGRDITVQAIRVADAFGNPVIDLSGPEEAIRVLSDSFSEDRPPVRIHNLGEAIVYGGFDRSDRKNSDVDVAVGSQLIYNPSSKQGLFFGALSSRRWLTIFHLRTSATASGTPSTRSYTVDSTGTTEIEKRESLSKAPPEDQIELSLPVNSGDEIASEPVLFAAGPDYHAALEDYGSAIRRLHKARVDKTGPSGWWSWIGYEGGITSGVAATNAAWLAQHWQNLGYNFVLIDEGYQYARGEYATTNQTQFPEGMRAFARRISRLGLNLGVWTAPFEVSERAWVYQNHKDWLVHNSTGAPIRIDQPGFEALYVLDATNAGAQEYLRQTYRTLAQDWGVKYIKLDFMDDTAIEGYYSTPNTTALQAQRLGLEVIRSAVGEDVLIDKDGSPMLNAVGIVDDGRVSTDTAHSFEATRTAALGIAARYYMNRNFFVNDPDAFTVSRPGLNSSASQLPLSEAEVGVVLAALSGGMFDIGGDITTLSKDPERLALAQNRDILEMVNLGRSAIPLDLMTYSEQDEMPSVYLLKENDRQSMIAVFNWTSKVRSHSLSTEDLHLPLTGILKAVDSLHSDSQVSIVKGSLELPDQAPHSVRLIKVVDKSAPVSVPSVSMSVPPQAEVGKEMSFSAESDPKAMSAAAYVWDFGDGVSEHGQEVHHAYTRAGNYPVVVTALGLSGGAARKTATVKVAGEIDSDFQFQQNRRYVEPQVMTN